MIKKTLYLLLIILLSSCSEPISENKFIGTWELTGRKMFNGMEVEIKKENEILVGRIRTLNDNKYVKLYVREGEIWIPAIKRISNSQFRLKEKKLAYELFSLYGLSTSEEYKVEFIDNNSFGLATNNKDPLESSIIYKRVK